MQEPRKPVRIVNSQAPIRICDNGMWTDTRLARYERVLNITVSPVVEVQLKIYNERNENARLAYSGGGLMPKGRAISPVGKLYEHERAQAAIAVTNC